MFGRIGDCAVVESGRGQRFRINDRKKKMIGLFKAGNSITDCLAEIGAHRTTYDRWRSQDPLFAAQMDEIRLGVSDGRLPVPDFETFCRDYLEQPLFWHQLQWADILNGDEPRLLHPSEVYEPGDPQYILVNTPPEHAKTMTLSICYVTWRVCKDPNIKVMLVSKTQDMAKEFLYAIKTRLTHPKYTRLQLAFGPVGGWKADSTVWSADQIYLGSERDSGEKDPTIQAVGIGGHIYGSRSDLILVDDGVVLSNAADYEKQLRWIQQEVITRLGPYGRLCVVGTRVDATDLYRELMNPDRYPSGQSPWTYFAQPAVLAYASDPKDWVTLWPRSHRPWDGSKDKPDKDGLYPRWDGQHLSRRRNILNPRTWALAYMQASVEEDATFDAAKVRACVNGMRKPGKLDGRLPNHRAKGMDGLYVIGSMDPAMVGDTAVLVYAVDRHERKRYILDGRLRTGASPRWIRDVIKELTDTYGIHEWRIERNSFQAFLTQDQELNEWLANMGVRLTEHTTGKNKWDPSFGIASMSSLFDFGLIELPGPKWCEPARQLMEQLITWSPETKGKTDMVLALWFAEIRAREVCKATPIDAAGGGGFMPNRYLSKRGKARQVVVNLNDLAIGRQMERQLPAGEVTYAS